MPQAVDRTLFNNAWERQWVEAIAGRSTAHGKGAGFEEIAGLSTAHGKGSGWRRSQVSQQRMGKARGFAALWRDRLAVGSSDGDGAVAASGERVEGLEDGGGAWEHVPAEVRVGPRGV
jgi:hypothetical protein